MTITIPVRRGAAAVFAGCAVLLTGATAYGAGGSSAIATNAAPVDGDLVNYCAAALGAESAQPDIDFQTATPEEMSAALKAFATDVLLPLVDTAAGAAPAELADEVEVYHAAFEELAATGDPAVFDSPALAEASATTHAYELEHCGWQTAAVLATDFAFGGLAPSYEVGPLSIDLVNDGTEVLSCCCSRSETASPDLRRTDGAERRRGLRQIDIVSGIDPVPPGESDYAVIEPRPAATSPSASCRRERRHGAPRCRRRPHLRSHGGRVHGRLRRSGRPRRRLPRGLNGCRGLAVHPCGPPTLGRAPTLEEGTVGAASGSRWASGVQCCTAWLVTIP